MTMANLSEVAYEHIHEDFYSGIYLDTSIIIVKNSNNKYNNYVNVTHLCTFSITLKKVNHWLALDTTKTLLSGVAQYIKETYNNTIVIGDLKYVKYASPKIHKSLRGTYVHPLLVAHIASWISPGLLAIKVSKIVNNHAIQAMKVKIAEKNSKIDEQAGTIADLKKTMAMILGNTNKLIDMNASLSSDIAQSNEKLDIVSEQLDISIIDRVPKTNHSKYHNKFAIVVHYTKFDNNGNIIEEVPGKVQRRSDAQYHFIRTQKRNFTSAYNRYKKDKTYVKIRHTITYTGNVINLGVRIMRQIGEVFMNRPSSINFTLKRGVKFSRFLVEVKKIEAQKGIIIIN